MAKPRQRQIPSARGNEKQNRDSRDDEEDWIVVKKQKVTIIIPPLQNKKGLSTMPQNLGDGRHLQEKPIKSNSQSRRETTSNSQFPSADAVVSKRSTEQAVCSPEILKISVPNLMSQKKPLMSRCRTKKSGDFPDLHNLGDDTGIGSKHSSPGDKRERKMIFVDTSGFLDRRRRAEYLDRKLKRAGGLDNWLASLGLTCFVKIFRRRNIVNRFQVASFSMKKLRDMGLEAVGPRRKLMHAIDCFCQPHCFHIG